MLNSLPVRVIWHSLNWLTRLTIVASVVLAVLMSLSILLLRYWLLPNVGQYQDMINTSLSEAIGNTVTIGRSAGNWQGLHPHLDLTDVRILDRQGRVALALPKISGSVSWMSLLSAELRLVTLEIDRPELLIRRDAQGQIYVGGVALSQQGNNNDLADWLLHQPRMVIRDAFIVWTDEQRDAPPLALKQVNLRIESMLNRHRFALRAVPPKALAAPVDVRGEFRGISFDDLGAWRGQLFTQIGHTDVNAWRPWLDLPGEFSQGSGALRAWLGIESGRVTALTADLQLHNVVARLAGDVPEMALHNLRGRVAWKLVAGGMEISARHLAMQLQNNIKIQPTDFYFRTTKSADGKPLGGALRANLLQLENLAALADFLPLEAGLRARLKAYAPGGKVSNLDTQWQGVIEKPDHFKIKGQFENLALRQVGAQPGFSGLTVGVDGSDTDGRLNINSRRVAVEAPGVMREPLFFATLAGQAGWQHKNGEWSVKVDNLAVANDDLAGNLYGSYQTRAGTLGMLDLTASLTRGDIRRAARYTPLAALDKEDNDWLNGAMLAGQTDDFRVRIKGNLSDFPLDGTEDALLEIGGHARDVAMAFHKDWPHIKNATGEFWIRGNKMVVEAPSATMLDAQLQNLTVSIADLQSEDLPLEIKGSAAGKSNTFLRFIQQSPVRGYIDGFTDGMSATGNGQLELFMHIPLLSDKPAEVSGVFSVRGNDINLGEGAPLLRNARGELSFTESGMQADDVSAEVLGGPANIDVRTAAGGVVHAAVRGFNELDTLRNLVPHPLLNYLYGGTAWYADITVVKKTVQMAVRSDLRGIGSNLPQPFFKRADEALSLYMEKNVVADGWEVIGMQLGKLLKARLARRDENGVMVIKRGIVNFGGQGHPGGKGNFSGWGEWPEKDGVWLSGTLPVLSLQGWGDLMGTPGGAGGNLPVAGVNMRIGKASGFGMVIDGLHIEAGKSSDGFVAKLSSETLNGAVDWQPQGQGKLTAHLKNLYWQRDADAASTAAQSGLPSSDEEVPISPGKLPVLQVSIENFKMGNKQVGRLELAGHPDGNEWRLQRLNVTNPDGSLTGEGVWRGTNGDAQTRVNLLLNISDAGKILARSGYPNTVKGGSGKLVADLSWHGSPDAFNYATLDGTLKLDTDKGQFLKMDSGTGKLLSILSLQALPKRITLDFTDVFSDGFQFDNINGHAQIKNGVIETQDLHIDGSSAKVTMKGRANLNNETQDLRVRILPTLGDSISLLSAFTAGPVIGLGSLLLSKVLGNPLDMLVSFEYNISGAWSDPQVAKVGQSKVDRKEKTP